MFKPFVQHMTFRGTEFSFFITSEIGKEWYGAADQSAHEEMAWCFDRVRPGMTVVDCGAHHGMFTVCLAIAAGPQGKVFSYEMLPDNAWTVDMNARLNKLRNVTVRPVGVSDKAARLSIAIDGDNSQVTTASPNDGPAKTAELVALDADLPSGTKVDFLKVDVEGHDLPALRGMRNVLSQRPVLNLELHNSYFADRAATLKSIVAMLEPLNYSYEVQHTIFEAPQPLPSLSAEVLGGMDHPHLLCTPR